MAALLRAVDDQDAGLGSGSESPEGTDKVVIAGRYELVGRVGRGATGSVYRAYDHTLVRHVAIKLLEPGEFTVAEREAQVLAKILHRNVVTVHHVGHDLGHGVGHGTDHRYIVFELLGGHDFHQWLQRGPAPTEIVERFLDAGRGLSAAHRAGLPHRDFKPHNVMLTNEGRVVVINFGLGHLIPDASDHDGLGLGYGSWRDLEPHAASDRTLAYMAPERIAGRKNDELSDQFSFCVALWEALAAANPFTGADPLARYRSIQHGPRREPPDAPPHVVAALVRGMSFEPDHRFATMAELLHQLEYPAERRRYRPTRPVLTAAAVAITFTFGWGFAPESATVGEAKSSLDSAREPASPNNSSSRPDHPSSAAKLVCYAELAHAPGAAGPDPCADRPDTTPRDQAR